jgi:hypothetical protein
VLALVKRLQNRSFAGGTLTVDLLIAFFAGTAVAAVIIGVAILRDEA